MRLSGRGGETQTAAGIAPAAVRAEVRVAAQLPVGVALAATFENVWLAFEPRVVIAAMQTTMIRASITAYSTAVGPSSFFRNVTNFLVKLRMRYSGSGI